MIIYRTTCLINDKFYVGQDSKNDPNYLGSGLLLERAIKKYGKENFTKEIIESCSGYEHLNEREIYWIDKLSATDTDIGYNISIGGQGGYLCKNFPEKLRGENYYLNRYTEKEREKHLSTFRRGINYWKSKGFKTIEEIEEYIRNNYCGKNHSSKKYKTDDEFNEWLNQTRRGKNFWLNRCLNEKQREKYIEDNYKGNNNPIFRNKNKKEIDEWLNQHRRGSNAPNAKYEYEIITESGEKIITDCLKTLCKQRNYNLHIILKLIKLCEGKITKYTPRDKQYVNWKISRRRKS